MRALAALIALLVTFPAAAQDRYSIGTCDQAQGGAVLETTGLRARINNDGGLFWRGAPSVYRVQAAPEAIPIFNAGLMIGGMINDDIRVAGSTYGPYEFWPGPLAEDGSAPSNCQQHDRLWVLDYDRDIVSPSGTSQPTPDLLEWPTKLGAPYSEINGTPGYQPDEGDIPVMLGDHQVWWIMNDRGNEKTRFDSKPLGVEVTGQAFGFDTPGDLGNTSFYRYQIQNKGDSTITDMVVGMHADFDLGTPFDDYIGTDTTLALFYVYNQDDPEKPPSNVTSYHSPVPAFGVTILEASHVSESLPTDLNSLPGDHASVSSTYNGAGGINGSPWDASDLFNYLNGRWKDGRPITLGGIGVDFTETPMPFFFPGDPVTGQYWSEVNSDGNGTPIAPADRRGILSYGSFDLAPGEWAQFTFAFVWARGLDHLDSITELRKATRFLHDNKGSILAPRTQGRLVFEDGNPPDATEYPFWVDEPYPNPAGDRITLRSSFDLRGPARIRVNDALGRTRIEKTVDVPSSGPKDIALDVSGLSPGSYTVSVERGSNRESHVFVVMR